MVTHIYLLRHGITEGDKRFCGHTDFMLTPEGYKQMETAVSGIEHKVDCVVSSPLSRCSQFAHGYATQNHLEYAEESFWQEIDFGDWDGKDTQQVWDEDKHSLSQFWKDPWKITPPNGESLVDYDQRIQLAWKSLLDTYQGKNVLLVTHGGVIKQIIRNLFDMPRSEIYLQRIRVPYAALLHVEVYYDENGKRWPQLYWPICLS